MVMRSFPPLALAHHEFPALQRQILHPQAQPLHEAQSAAVEQACYQPGSALELRQQCTHLGTGQNHRQALGSNRAGDVGQPGQIDFQHVPVQEQQCLQRLVLRGRAHLAVHREMRQELLDLGRAELARVPPLMEDHVTPDPLQVRLLAAQRQVPRAHFLARHREQAGFLVHDVCPSGAR